MGQLHVSGAQLGHFFNVSSYNSVWISSMFLELLDQFCNVTGAAGGSATCIRSAIRSVP